MHEFLYWITELVVVLIEYLAVFIAIYTVARSLYELIFEDRFHLEQFNRRDTLTTGMISCLELLMVAEILKTVFIVKGQDVLMDLVILGAMVFLRTFIVHHLKKNLDEKR